MSLRKIVSGAEDFMSWLKMVYPGYELREFTDAFGPAVEVVEHTEHAIICIDVFVMPSAVWHDDETDELIALPVLPEL